jgi:hypothetical protein
MSGLIATRERKMLRLHPAIIAAIERFWCTISKAPLSYESDEMCVRWKEYLDLHMKMARVLHGNFAPLRVCGKFTLSVRPSID